MTDQNTRPQPSAEPVAWMYQWRNKNTVYMPVKRDWADYPNNAGWTETPLYPASALEAARREALEQFKREVGGDLWHSIVTLQGYRTAAKGDGRDGKLWQSLHDGIDGLFSLWTKHHFAAALKENPNAG